uniref:NEDD8-activating enzyme E1 catalytic subunit n=1 Tax=Acrobeloides nanus TaxID=290746 RepID=A0A914D194_9BILA
MDVCTETEDNRWTDIRQFTDNSSSFAHPAFEPGADNFKAIQQCRVLVVGAGGLGCEILKNLALSGFQNIDVIDMDTIDLSNLNRQFLFRESDVGTSKAEVAANFINRRVKGCKVIPHNCKIQDKGLDFYRQFSMVICGLDSIVARRWLNAALCNLVAFEEGGEIDQDTIIPLIDGGTEGFKGNARVVFPHYSPCIECTLDLYPPQVNFPLCTIAHTPRLPEHCVEYVKVILWEKESPFKEQLDGDNPHHVDWVLNEALKRAANYGIQGVNLRLTQGVLKRIIPAVATTNAIIAGSCALEALKLASNISCSLNNYLNFTNVHEIFYGVVKLEKNPECIVCSRSAITFYSRPEWTLETFMEKLTEKYQLRNPTLKSSTKYLYMINNLLPELVDISRNNLSKSLAELGLADGDELLISDESLHEPITLRLNFTDD